MVLDSSTNQKREPTQDPYRLYEEGLRLLHERKYKEAEALLQEIRDRFHSNTDLVARVNQLLRVPEKRKAAENHLPVNAAGWTDRAVVFHNMGDYKRAIECLEQALKVSGKQEHDYIYYVYACSEARQGNTDKALDYLKKAIQLKSELRFMARSDPDFQTLSQNSEFRELVRGPQNK
ncbi:MAG TPA: tetratricopeptide repeat protein [Acidobacteriota bacterium]|nr:tetratricopeptide repeat protein [Acidobacteriota bacterium]